MALNAEVSKIDPTPVTAEDLSEADSGKPSAAASLWAMLIARIYEILPLVCPRCGGELKIIAFLTETGPVQRILIHIGEPTTPPRIASARAPPDWIETDFDQTVLNESENLEPVPEFEFDQTVSW